MTIILTGGGSGGHITPIMAVAEALKNKNSSIKIIYIGQIGDEFSDNLSLSKYIDEIYKIRAGKFRRYYGEGIKQILHLKTLFFNLRDLIYFIIGTFQSWRLLKKINPDVVFTRGGYISVPVALGARFNKVPYITHDSDMVPSLANKLIASSAKYNLISFDGGDYPYKKSKIINTGIPINNNFKIINEAGKKKFRGALKLPNDSKVLLIIGGGQGSVNINSALTSTAKSLFNDVDNLYILHIAGQKNIKEVNKQYSLYLSRQELSKVNVFGYINDVYKYSGAADLIIARAGATNIAEFAAQGKACLIIPSKFLVGGHQIKNSDVLKAHKAAAIYDEDNLTDHNRFLKTISSLLNNKKELISLEKNIHKLARLSSASTIADLIIKVGEREPVRK